MTLLTGAGQAFASAGEIVEAARSRSNLQPWEVAEAATFRLVAGTGGPGRELLDARTPGLGSFTIDQDEVVAYAAPDPRAAEAALKVAFAYGAFRAGGLLVHSAAFAWAGQAGVLVVGPSGAGKSTLSRLAVGSGAKLLSDETNLLLATREVAGTPFRSDMDLQPSPSHVPLRAVLTLTHGSAERWRPLSLHHVVARVLAQAYRLGPSVVSQQDLMDRTATLVDGVPAFDFTFRKDPAAAAWLREALGLLG